MTDREFLASAGFDAVVMVRVTAFGIALFVPMTILGIGVGEWAARVVGGAEGRYFLHFWALSLPKQRFSIISLCLAVYILVKNCILRWLLTTSPSSLPRRRAVLPVNYTGGYLNTTQGSSGQAVNLTDVFEKLTISNIKPGSNLLW